MSNSDEISPARTAPSPELIPMLSDPEISIHENGEMKGVENYSIEQMNYLLYLSSKCERYEDVIEVFERLHSNYSHTPLSPANKNILESTVKNQVGVKQKQINKLNSLLEYSDRNNKTDGSKKDQKHLLKAINKEKERIIDETSEFIYRIMKLIDGYLLKINSIGNQLTDKETEVFLLRIKADNYQYLSQLEMNITESQKHLQSSKNSFVKAYQISKDYLITTNIEHLKLVYFYSSFISFLLKNQAEAEELLKDFLSNEKITEMLQGNALGLEVNSERIELIETISQFNSELKANKHTALSN